MTTPNQQHRVFTHVSSKKTSPKKSFEEFEKAASRLF